MPHYTDLFSQEEVVDELRLKVIAEGGQKATAERLGVSPAYLHDVLMGRRDPGNKILSALGYTRVVCYKATGEEQ